VDARHPRAAPSAPSAVRWSALPASVRPSICTGRPASARLLRLHWLCVAFLASLADARVATENRAEWLAWSTLRVAVARMNSKRGAKRPRCSTGRPRNSWFIWMDSHPLSTLLHSTRARPVLPS
jgi:hypothetical protein